MKRIILAIAMVIVMMLSMTACNNDTGELSNEYMIVHKYKGLIISEVEVIKVTNELIDKLISSNLREGITSREVTDRPARLGDAVIIDFAGSIDGVFFDGGTATDVPLTLGDGAFIGPYGGYEGFEEQIVGHEAGTSFDIEVMFPEDYHAPDLVGQVAVFEIYLHSITELNVPELTDEWVRENSLRGSTTVEEYREEIRAEAEEHYERSAIDDMQLAIFDALMLEVELIQPLPEESIEREMEMVMDFYREIAESYGMEFEDFLSMNGVDEETLREMFAKEVEQSVKRQSATTLIAEREGLILSEDELRERMEDIAERGGFGTVEDYIAHFGEELIRSSIQQIVVAEFLIEHAEFVSEQEFAELMLERELERQRQREEEDGSEE